MQSDRRQKTAPWRTGRKAEIYSVLDKLRDEFATLFVADEDSWYQGTLEAYYDKLKGFETEVVEQACKLAAAGRDKFPSAPLIVSHCRKIIADRKDQERVDGIKADRIRRDAEDREAVDLRREEIIPHDHQAQDRWIADGETPLERMARRYEVDSKRRGTDPNSLQRILDDAGRPIHTARFADFWGAFAATPEAEIHPDYRPRRHHKEEPGL
jgi:hypothetical protein